MEQQILAWVAQYGYLAIFLCLVLGIVGLPIPDETMLTFAGYLVFKGHLSLGMPLVHRYGRYLHLNEERINKAHRWFDRIGHWALTVGYFIPGIRHFTAYAAGMSGLEPRQFALFAYSGAVLWISTFIGLGYLLGERWQSVQKNIDHYIVGCTILCAIALVGWLVWRKFRRS